jgi:hypothetical protein
MESSVVFFADRPDPFKEWTCLVLASKKRQNMSPPIPVEEGSVTLRAAAEAHR